jgi:hypothetical protein
MLILNLKVLVLSYLAYTGLAVARIDALAFRVA